MSAHGHWCPAGRGLWQARRRPPWRDPAGQLSLGTARHASAGDPPRPSSWLPVASGHRQGRSSSQKPAGVQGFAAEEAQPRWQFTANKEGAGKGAKCPLRAQQGQCRLGWPLSNPSVSFQLNQDPLAVSSRPPPGNPWGLSQKRSPVHSSLLQSPWAQGPSTSRPSPHPGSFPKEPGSRSETSPQGPEGAGRWPHSPVTLTCRERTDVYIHARTRLPH